ncbi:MAG: 4Fe-4S binding protein [Thermoleophilia bacterium]|nr:4Fe-4S binding protein [Thermoleophilia bacterium]
MTRTQQGDQQGLLAVATKSLATKKIPVFNLVRCKRCGICSHFCPQQAIGTQRDGTPFLADAEACTSCRLCEDMCPDWAVCLTPLDAAAPGSTSAG